MAQDAWCSGHKKQEAGWSKDQDEKTGDNSEFKNLLNQSLEAGKPGKLLADSA